MMYILLILLLFFFDGIHAIEDQQTVPAASFVLSSEESNRFFDENEDDDAAMMESLFDQAEIKPDAAWVKFLKTTGSSLYVKLFMLQVMMKKNVENVWQWILS